MNATPAVDASFEVLVGGRRRPFRLAVELRLDQGVLVLFGPSGSGKSLTLQALAGLIRPTRGRIVIGGRPLYDGEARVWVPPHRRRVGYVPQHHVLFPFRDVADNVAFGLPRRERRRDNPRVVALLDEVGLAHLAAAEPASLSGGERQRVALARALIVRPDVLLLDEPLASIDPAGRAELRAVVVQTLRRHGTPAVFVTHSRREALRVGDRAVLYERGRTAACGTPAELLVSDAPMHLSGRLAGSAGEEEDGRVRVELAQAVLTGPRDLLQPTADGSLDLLLETRKPEP